MNNTTCKYKLFFAAAKCLLFFVVVLFAGSCYAGNSDSDFNAEKQALLHQQVENLKAQTAYYEKQTKDKSVTESVTGTLMNAIGTFIGAGLALFGVRWSSNRQWKLEEAKWNKAKTDEAKKETRSAATDLTKVVAATIQTIIWLTWIAKYESATFSENDITEYNNSVKKLFNDCIVAQTYLCSLNKELYKATNPFMRDIYTIDHKISMEFQKFKQATDNADKVRIAEAIGEYYLEVCSINNNLPEQLGDIFKSVNSYDHAA